MSLRRGRSESVKAPAARLALALAMPLFAAPSPPLAPLPMLPSIPRVRVEIGTGHLVVIEEVNLPRGDWNGEPLDFYVAFGAPGTPRAIDAHLVAVGDGALEPEEGDAGEALAIDRAPRRPPSAHPLLGRDTMAGVVVHVEREALSRALAPGSMAALRVRTVLDLPDEDPSGARGVVVRLGASRGTPLTLGRLTIASRPGSAAAVRAGASLCGPEADTRPLAIAIAPRPSGAPRPAPSTAIAPVLSVRHVTDDLCIKYWTAS
ncbi:MAG: hypothetical protein KF819_03940 [Labilithrix sp.]|nr:hypothetical protein [Labilithrix sp.]